jgi:hypothetical protein
LCPSKHVKIHRKNGCLLFNQTWNHDRQIGNASFHKVVIEVKVKGLGQTMISYKQRTDQYIAIKLGTVMDRAEKNLSA